MSMDTLATVAAEMPPSEVWIVRASLCLLVVSVILAFGAAALASYEPKPYRRNR